MERRAKTGAGFRPSVKQKWKQNVFFERDLHPFVVTILAISNPGV
jgi:hypothetical protein